MNSIQLNPESIIDSFSFSLNSLMEAPLFLFGAYLVAFLLSAIMNILIRDILTNSILASITSILLEFALNIEIFNINNIVVQEGTITFNTYVPYFIKSDYPKIFLNYIIATIFDTFAIIFGLILFIIPGIYIGQALQFASYVVLDKRVDAVNAIKLSANITNGNKWVLILFALFSFTINFFGLLFIGIGLLFTIPLTSLAYVYIYRKLIDTQNNNMDNTNVSSFLFNEGNSIDKGLNIN